jgi:cystathionine beta-lyase/cystathionine gamma-synthase
MPELAIEIAARDHLSAVPIFESVEALERGLEAKDKHEDVDLYMRDGSVALGQAEARIAELNGLERRDVIIFSTGMAAVTAAVWTSLTYGDYPASLAASNRMYSKTTDQVDNAWAPLIPVYKFDSGDPESISQVINVQRPKVLIAEPVANAVGMPVLDIDRLLETASGKGDEPTLLFDTTFTLTTAQSLPEVMTADRRILGVESGTKAYTHNGESLGIVYTKHVGLQRKLRDRRREIGPTLGVKSLEEINKNLPRDSAEFHTRNQAVMGNTAALAIAAFEAAQASGNNVTVTHPTLPNHPNHELYHDIYPNEASPVFFITSATLSKNALARWLESQAGIVDDSNSKISQSFGFDSTRLLIDKSANAVRIAGGALTDVDQLAPALADAITSLPHN